MAVAQELAAPLEIQEYSVSEISTALKRMIEQKYSYVRVRGEISGLKQAPSGHCYFSLKDANAVLASVCWRGNWQRLSPTPQEGLEVVCTGTLTTYAGQSKYQLVVEHIAPAGVGALMSLLEQRKKKLAAEGLFAPERKKKLPQFPQIIGVVTSPTGAVIRDIIHRLEDRYPLQVLLWPVLVQGEQAAGQIAAAIDGFNQLANKPDLIIVARGGGSIEDLWAFNEEIVVRAAANSSIPLISAVGHETDTTLIDYAADLRAPTPSAAAELAVPDRLALLATLEGLGITLWRLLSHIHKSWQHKLEKLGWNLPRVDLLLVQAATYYDSFNERLDLSLQRYVAQQTQLYKTLQDRLQLHLLAFQQQNSAERLLLQSAGLEREFTKNWQRKSDQLQIYALLLESYNYASTLKRGYAAAFTRDKQPITSAASFPSNSEVLLEFHDGKVAVVKSNCSAE